MAQPLKLIGLAGLAVSLCLSAPAVAAWSFIEPFDGGFTHNWLTNFGLYLAPGTTFTTIDGASVCELTSVSSTPNSFGYVGTQLLSGNVGVLEARFNTRSQSSSSYMSLFILALGHAESHVALMSMVRNQAIHPMLVFTYFSGTFENNPVSFSANTWYRFQIHSTPEALEARLLSDDGTLLLSRQAPAPLDSNILMRPEFAQFTSTTTTVAIDFIAAFPPPTCAGDANGDNLINAADLSVLLADFSSVVGVGSAADFNANGRIEAGDLSVLLANFGDGC